jgi:amidase
MARDCKTAAALLSVIAGKDTVADPATGDIPFDTIPDYASACTADGLKGARIGRSQFGSGS